MPIRYRVEPRDLSHVPPKFREGMFGDLADVVEARIDRLSPSQDPHHAEVVRFYRWLLGQATSEAYGRLQQEFLAPGAPEVAYLRYLDPIRWFEHKLKYARTIGLDQRPPCRILDLGTGAGHFLLVARFYGHEAIGTEVPYSAADRSGEAVNQRLFDVFAAVWRHVLVRHEVQPFVELQGLPGRFDLVTSFSTLFDRPPRWNREAWVFFLDSLKRHVLTEGGALFATLSRSRLDPEIWAYLSGRSRRLPQSEPAIWIETARKARTNEEPDGDEVSALYRDLPYLEAYSRHTDLRVRSDPQQAIGGHWEALGKLQFDYLVANGLKPEHRLLDIGCGTLRGGRHFIRYLAPGGYTGIDISSGAIASGRQLVEAEGLVDRKPALIWNRQPDLWFAPPVDGTFDMLLAQSVFTHLDVPHIAACFAELHRVMAPDARFFFTYNTGKATERMNLKSFRHPFALFEDLARRHGFLVERRSDYAHPRRQAMAVLARR